MSLPRLPSFILSLTVLGCSLLLAQHPLLAATAPLDRTVQHLTCLKNSQGYRCTIDETQEPVTVKIIDRSAVAQTNFHLTNLTSDQLQQISTGLIGLMFVGLPIGLVLVIMLHHQREVKHTKRLEQLEKIWQRS